MVVFIGSCCGGACRERGKRDSVVGFVGVVSFG